MTGREGSGKKPIGVGKGRAGRGGVGWGRQVAWLAAGLLMPRSTATPPLPHPPCMTPAHLGCHFEYGNVTRSRSEAAFSNSLSISIY